MIPTPASGLWRNSIQSCKCQRLDALSEQSTFCPTPSARATCQPNTAPVPQAAASVAMLQNASSCLLLSPEAFWKQPTSKSRNSSMTDQQASLPYFLEFMINKCTLNSLIWKTDGQSSTKSGKYFEEAEYRSCLIAMNSY